MDVRLESPYAVNECRRRIHEAFDGPLTATSSIRSVFALRRMLLGRIDDDRITMRMTGPTTDSFPSSRASYHPTLRARIGSQGSGSVLTGDIADTSTYLRAFSIVWLGALVLFFLPVTLIGALRQISTQPAALIAPLFCVLLIVVGWSYFRWLGRVWQREAAYLVSRLADAIDARDDTPERIRVATPPRDEEPGT